MFQELLPGILKKKYGDYIVNIRPNIKIEDRIIEIIATIDYTLVHFESVFLIDMKTKNSVSSFKGVYMVKALII
jgi:hypothetical protein